MKSLRIIYWIPVGIFFILNMFFKLIIFILQNIGNVIVWCNRLMVKCGDYYTDLAQDDEALDKFILKLYKSVENKKERRKK